MSVSVGGGPNKLIAKLAAERAKPSRSPEARGVFVVDVGGELDFMRTVALAEIPGIGPKLQEKLRGVGLVTVNDVLPHDVATLERWLGAPTAAWLHRRVRGEGRDTVESHAPAKQMSREETFDRDIADSAKLHSELRHLAAKVAADMRGDGLATRTITVKLRTKDFTTRSASRTLRQPVESDRAVTDTALELLEQLRRGRSAPARLVGVALSNLTPGRDAEQMSMFGATIEDAEAPERERDRDLSRAVDLVREKFGDGAIRTGPARRRPIGEKGARKPRD
jgi:DNA polymerase-4